MLGWTLFAKAVTLVTDNLALALRVSAVPYLLVVAATVWAHSVAPEAVRGGFDPASADPGALWAAFVPMLAILVAGVWIAVAWHRATLLGEESGWVPPLHGGLVLGYLGRSLLLAIVVGLATSLAGAVAGLLVLPLLGGAGVGVIGAVAFFVAMILFYRLAVVLPAGAVGAPLTVAEAWGATRGHTNTVVALALLTAVLGFVLQLPVAAGGGFALVYLLVVQWAELMIAVSVLTVLYGHLVEDRPL